jgi:hypothetical protein
MNKLGCLVGLSLMATHIDSALATCSSLVQKCELVYPGDLDHPAFELLNRTCAAPGSPLRTEEYLIIKPIGRFKRIKDNLFERQISLSISRLQESDGGGTEFALISLYGGASGAPNFQKVLYRCVYTNQ